MFLAQRGAPCIQALSRDRQYKPGAARVQRGNREFLKRYGMGGRFVPDHDGSSATREAWGNCWTRGAASTINFAMLPLLLGNAPAGAVGSPEAQLLIQHPTAVLAVLATIFRSARHATFGRIFKIVPTLVFCYFVPTFLTTMRVIPAESPLYAWVKSFVLPASLLLLILALDPPGIIRLGPKAVLTLLSGTLAVVIGGLISLLICKGFLPDDAWKGMAALCGSWIGGGANMIALKETVGCSDELLSIIIIVDVFVANIWMGTLLFLASRQEAADRWIGADATAIRQLERKMTDFQARVGRIPAMPDLMTILALGFVGTWLSYKGGEQLGMLIHDSNWFRFIEEFVPSDAWKYIIVTTLGLLLSFTPARGLEGAGASKVGAVMIYLLVACIGASADFRKIADCPAFILMGAIWMAIHVVVILGVRRLIRAPIFFIAVGSQSNIGGAASAPVVASAFHPSLAPVGALLAIVGYVLGTYAGLVCIFLLKTVAGVLEIGTAMTGA
jgi:uncharacterized membrane protein